MQINKQREQQLGCEGIKLFITHLQNVSLRTLKIRLMGMFIPCSMSLSAINLIINPWMLTADVCCHGNCFISSAKLVKQNRNARCGEDIDILRSALGWPVLFEYEKNKRNNHYAIDAHVSILHNHTIKEINEKLYKVNKIIKWKKMACCHDKQQSIIWNKTNSKSIEYRSDDVTKNFFCISAFWIPCLGGAWWKTSTAQIWWESVHGGPRYGRMNTYLAPLKSV